MGPPPALPSSRYLFRLTLAVGPVVVSVHVAYGAPMCRNIKTLHNFKPPATEDEIRASSVQFVRKLSGFARPSKANQLAFDRAVDEVANAARELLQSLVPTLRLAIGKSRRSEPGPERPTAFAHPR